MQRNNLVTSHKSQVTSYRSQAASRRHIFAACSLQLAAVYCLLTFFGCASAPVKERIATYTINGATYMPLGVLCGLKDIGLEYDTYTKTVVLSKETHKINLMVADTIALVDGKVMYLRHPVEMHQGALMVPAQFKEQVLDTLFRKTYTRKTSSAKMSKLRKVVIDAGHGGNDPGAIGKTGLREKDVNLDVAKRVAQLLKAEGIEVVMTRSIDKFIPLGQRVRIANNSEAGLFVAIHSNANRVRTLNGFEVYHVASSVSDTKRAYEAAREVSLSFDRANFASNSMDVKATLWDMLYTLSRAESIDLSRSLCQVMKCNLDAKILGVKGARFEVLRGVRMPGVLIEMGFLSNAAEERMLKNSFYRQKIAQGIVEGIRAYSARSTFTEIAKQ